MEQSISGLDSGCEHVLRRLGFSAGAVFDLRAAMRTDERARVIRWISGMVSPRGVDWSHEVRGCGQLFPVRLPDGQIRIMPMTCKCRACPRCMHDRAARLAGSLREAAELRAFDLVERPEGGDKLLRRRLVFVTLTQRKRDRRNEDAGASIARLLKSWKRLVSPQSKKRNEDLRAMIFGGVRSLECVWSPRNKLNKNGRRARYSGWHTHAHCIFELRNFPNQTEDWLGEFADELRAVWAWASKDSNPETGVDVQTLDMRKVGQLAKYLTKPFELNDHRARELFRAASSRRILNGFGGWLSWRKWLEDRESEFKGATFSTVSLASLVRLHENFDAKGRGALVAPSVAFAEWHRCEDRGETFRRIAATVDREAMWDGLRRSAAAVNLAAADRENRRMERAGVALVDDPVSKTRRCRIREDRAGSLVNPKQIQRAKKRARRLRSQPPQT